MVISKKVEEGLFIIDYNDGGFDYHDDLNISHREDDGPAYFHPQGFMNWCNHGRFHRQDGPAALNPHGSRFQLWSLMLNGRLLLWS